MSYKKNYKLPFSVGDLIKNILAKKGIKQSYFAEQMGFGRSNASSLLNRKDWYVSRLVQASEVLDVNLFAYFIKKEDYQANVLNESAPIWEVVQKENKARQTETDLKECKESLQMVKEYAARLRDENESLKAAKR